jgi:pyruvate kinase
MRRIVPPPPIDRERASLAGVRRELVDLERRLDDLEKEMSASIERVPEEHRESARNLVHYIALRHHDLRDLQLRLAQLGLSSLGRSEGCVRWSLGQVSRRANEALALRGMTTAEHELCQDPAAETDLTWEHATLLLHEHTHQILGPRPDDRHVYIMVTAPSAAEADRSWMVRMLTAGMNMLRINCAHEGRDQWRLMVNALAEARRETGRECRILMDLAGPKIRTGSIADSRRILTWKPVKDDLGAVTAPARVIIARKDQCGPETPGPLLVLGEDAFRAIRPGDVLRFRDARGKPRTLEVRVANDKQLVAEGKARAYVLNEARATIHRGAKRVRTVTLEVGGASATAIDVRIGDRLVLAASTEEGRPPRRDGRGRLLEPGVVTCTLPAALEHLQKGHRVLFDDGLIEAVVEESIPKRGQHLLRIVRTQKAIAKLRAEKGINLPDTVTTIPALTEEDIRALSFVTQHADAVSISFVRRSEDIRRLHEELARLGNHSIGIVLKIETRAGFENLASLLLEGLRRPPLAVMIARGDLAAEVGFERLAELQEEILWLCEASHVPAIWATQVLDTLARTGVPSRAEVTDAAASVAAECVMLNKGQFVEEAVRVLADILRRMEKHHYKKRSLFRKLRVSTFIER